MQKHLECRVCSSQAELLGIGNVIGKNVSYFECKNCGYVQTEQPYWLDEAYSDVINLSDTGIMARNLANRDVVTATMRFLGMLNEPVVDAAGGMGILVRLLRDDGIDAFWDDPYCANELARGFEYRDQQASLVTAFEAFEHFPDPVYSFQQLVGMAPNVLLSTTFIDDPAPQPGHWWYYGEEHGQHIGFFRPQTLVELASSANKYCVHDGRSLALITAKPVNQDKWRDCLKRRGKIAEKARKNLDSKTWPDHVQLATMAESR